MDMDDRRYNDEVDVETAAVSVEVETEEDRGNWSRHIEFVLATIGFAVGLGNVWRFPYLCQKNGGGAFLVPYFLCLIIAGIPIFLLELGIGQRLRRGSISCWNEISPYLGGVGIACMIVSFFVSIYYNMIIGWSFYYMFVTMQEKLPYQTCPDHLDKVMINGSLSNETQCTIIGSTSYYWYHENLEISSDMKESGGMLWHLCLVLLLAWVIVYSVMMKGLAAAGKVVYFTSLFPYVVLFIFFIRGLTLEGASVGIKHMFTPDFNILKDPIVWLEAATQIFFSLSLAFGGLVSMASYNPVHNNCVRDSIVVALVNCGTSLFASIVVFAVLGFKATQVCNNAVGPCSVEDELENVASGAGLTFIAFTEAIAQMPVPHLWAILFFMMLITLGLGSMFGTMEGVVTPIFDAKLTTMKKPYITGALCIVCYLVGLTFCQRSGVYWLEVFNDYSGTIPLLTIAFFELVGVSWVYGVEKFERDLEFMVGSRPRLYWRICWKYVGPLFIIVIFFASLVGMAVQGISYERWVPELGVKVKTKFHGSAYFVIVFLIMLPLSFIPGVALVRFLGYCPYKSRGAAAINLDDDDDNMMSGTITPNLSRLPLTSNAEEPDQKEDNDEVMESLLGHKRESVL